MAQTPLITLADIELGFGGKPLFKGVSLSLAKGERAALVGRNGAGKSTLMKILSSQVEPDKGEIWQQPGTTFAMVRQEPDLSQYSSVMEFVSEDLDADFMAEAELMNFKIDPTADPATLSGGQQRRAALAKAFARDPDILMMDEPTNHLDIAMIETLEERLIAFRGIVLVVSHDRKFLERVSTTTLWLRQGLVLKSPKGYAEFDQWAETVETAELRQLQKIKTKMKAEKRWLDRGVSGRRKRNQGRLARMKDMRAKQHQMRSALNERMSTADLGVQLGGSMSKKVIEARKLSKSFQTPAGELTIVKDLDLKILRGDRVGILGPNGAGKSTLVKLLLKQLEPDSGSIKHSRTLELTYLDQTRAKLNPKDTLWEALAPQGGDSIMVQGKQRHVAAYAKDFLFKPDQLRQAVGAFSGGERNRLSLAIGLAKAANLLVLDEPTNDLDMQTLDLLEDMLLNFDGTLILVSHDRAFLDSTVTSTLSPMGDGKWIETPGGWSDAIRQLAPHKQTDLSAQKLKGKTKKSLPEPAKVTKLSFKDEHRQKELDTLIPNLQAEISTLESKLSDPNLYADDAATFDKTLKRLAAAKEELNTCEMDWLEIEEKREALG